MPICYHLPPFLEGVLTRAIYVRWLQRKAVAHVRRDRRRWHLPVTISAYKQEIHQAVLRSKGRDFYTDEELDWPLLSKYDNKESQRQGSKYKSKFALLPTVDHVGPESMEPKFEICGWRTNDCKNDLTIEELEEFCEMLLRARAKSRP